MRILEEIRRKCKNQDIVESEVKPIDYCYVQLHHIPAVNSICKEFFWSGIDGKNRKTSEYSTRSLKLSNIGSNIASRFTVTDR